MKTSSLIYFEPQSCVGSTCVSRLISRFFVKLSIFLRNLRFLYQELLRGIALLLPFRRVMLFMCSVVNWRRSWEQMICKPGIVLTRSGQFGCTKSTSCGQELDRVKGKYGRIHHDGADELVSLVKREKKV